MLPFVGCDGLDDGRADEMDDTVGDGRGDTDGLVLVVTLLDEAGRFDVVEWLERDDRTGVDAKRLEEEGGIGVVRLE